MMTARNILIALVALAIMTLGLSDVGAATITWDGGGSDNVWTTPGNWSDDLAPHPGADYEIVGAYAESPNSTSNVFAGDSLTIRNGANLRFYRHQGGTVQWCKQDIPNLSVQDASLLSARADWGAARFWFPRSIDFTGNSQMAFTYQNYWAEYHLRGGMTGSGTMTVAGPNSGFNSSSTVELGGG